MLIGALVCTILGFVALVVAVATGQVVFAWLCIFAGIAGVGLLIIDAARRKSRRENVESFRAR